MPVYFVAFQTVKDQAKLDEYSAKVVETIPPEMKVLAIDANVELLEGDEAPRTVILEFPTREDFRRWHDSPEYQAIAHLRKEGAPGTAVIAEGFVMPDA